MPRKAREKILGSTYHIITKGNNKQNTFQDGYDKEYFIYLLLLYREKFKYNILSYVIMNNYAHFILETKDIDVSQIMHSIGLSYAKYFNKKYNRISHVFHDRFRSIIIDSDIYLLTLSKYIHNSPVKDGFATKIDDYNWSSYNEIAGKCKYNTFDYTKILRYFSDDLYMARSLFDNYLNSDQSASVDKELQNTKIEMFIENNFTKMHPYVNIINKVKEFYNYSDIDFNIDDSKISGQIKSSTAYLLHKYTNLTQNEIANIAGFENTSSTKRAIKRADIDIANKIMSL